MNPALFLTNTLAYLFGTYYRTRGWRTPAIGEAHAIVWAAREEVRRQAILDRAERERRIA